ncbi:MAG: trimethylamine methyltransferase family protein [Promethearchaeota archaeon]
MNVSLLSKNDIEKIHEASLTILERIGIHVPHDEILSRFAKIGAVVDFNKNLVKIPLAIVKELISEAGKKFSLYGRNISKKAEFGVGKRNFNTTLVDKHSGMII